MALLFLRSASRPCRFIPRERTPGTHRLGGWVGLRAALYATKKILVRQKCIALSLNVYQKVHMQSSMLCSLVGTCRRFGGESLQICESGITSHPSILTAVRTSDIIGG
jgi:hypothetical protein